MIGLYTVRAESARLFKYYISTSRRKIRRSNESLINRGLRGGRRAETAADIDSRSESMCPPAEDDAFSTDPESTSIVGHKPRS